MASMFFPINNGMQYCPSSARLHGSSLKVHRGLQQVIHKLDQLQRYQVTE